MGGHNDTGSNQSRISLLKKLNQYCWSGPNVRIGAIRGDGDSVAQPATLSPLSRVPECHLI